MPLASLSTSCSLHTVFALVAHGSVRSCNAVLLALQPISLLLKDSISTISLGAAVINCQSPAPMLFISAADSSGSRRRVKFYVGRFTELEV